jgi:glyoxylase I family protein
MSGLEPHGDKHGSEPGKVLVKTIDHCSLIVADTAKAVDFYREILSLEVDDSRPELGYPGAWLWVGDRQFHLIEVPNPYSDACIPEHGRNDRHVALQVSRLDVIVQRLEAASIDYKKSRSGRQALFFRDLDNNTIELVEK